MYTKRKYYAMKTNNIKKWFMCVKNYILLIMTITDNYDNV